MTAYHFSRKDSDILYITNRERLFVVILFLLFILTGCDRLIDLDIPENPENPNLTLEGIESTILGVYSKGRFIHSSDDYSVFKLCHSDEIMLGTNLPDQPVFEEYAKLTSFTATNKAVLEIWNGYYTGLKYANSIIEAKDEVIIDEMNSDEVNRKNTVVGEAYYFRAYFHLSLIERWDHIVMMDHVFNNPSEPVSLADSLEVYNLIVSDLEEAISLLPEAVPGQPVKVSKGVARHLLSLVFMSLQRYPEAFMMAQQVIDDPAYDLVPSSNIADIFSCHHQDNSEIIFSWLFSSADRDNPQRCSVQLMPLYSKISGVTISWEGGGRNWSRLLPSPYYWTLFEADDLRLEAWHKRFWTYNINSFLDPLPPGVSLGDTVTLENIWLLEENLYTNDTSILIAPTTRKYWEDGSLGRKLIDAEGYRNIILYRISQAYLIAAEALMRDGRPDEGQYYFDKIRNRAGLASLPLTENNLIDEQLRELGHEGHRYAFLKRLGILYERVTEYCPEVGEVYQPFHTRWPIPQSFVDISNVPQNEGY